MTFFKIFENTSLNERVFVVRQLPAETDSISRRHCTPLTIFINKNCQIALINKTWFYINWYCLKLDNLSNNAILC